MSPVTAASVVTHALQLRLATALFAIVASFAAVNLAQTVGGVAKALWTRFAQSGSGRRSTRRLDSVGVR